MRPAAPALSLLLGLSCGAAPGQGPGAGPALVADFEARHAQALLASSRADSPEARYDALSEAFVGEALTGSFRRAQAAQRHRDDGDAQLILDEITHERVEILGPRDRGVEVEAHWRTRGSLEHSGHRHPRHLRNMARFWLLPGQDGWRIAEVTPLAVLDLPAAAPTAIAPDAR